MITAACAVVNGGRLMKPYLVEAIEDGDGNVLEQTSPKAVSTPISAETSATMRKLLYGVVENGGGKNARGKRLCHRRQDGYGTDLQER